MKLRKIKSPGEMHPIDGMTFTLIVLVIGALLTYNATSENAKYAQKNKPCIEVRNPER